MQPLYVFIKFAPNPVILNRSCTILNDRVGANSLENLSAQIDVSVDNAESYIVEK